MSARGGGLCFLAAVTTQPDSKKECLNIQILTVLSSHVVCLQALQNRICLHCGSRRKLWLAY